MTTLFHHSALSMGFYLKSDPGQVFYFEIYIRVLISFDTGSHSIKSTISGCSIPEVIMNWLMSFVNNAVGYKVISITLLKTFPLCMQFITVCVW